MSIASIKQQFDTKKRKFLLQIGPHFIPFLNNNTEYKKRKIALITVPFFGPLQNEIKLLFLGSFPVHQSNKIWPVLRKKKNNSINRTRISKTFLTWHIASGGNQGYTLRSSRLYYQYSKNAVLDVSSQSVFYCRIMQDNIAVKIAEIEFL